MREPLTASAAHPPALLDDHIAVLRSAVRSALPATAIRNRSRDARLLLARAALGAAGSLADLLAAARKGDRRWLARIRRDVDAGALAALAQTLAFQDMQPDDRRDALGIFELVHAVYGPQALSTPQQGLHAQLVLAWEGPARVPELLTAYRVMREPTRAAVEVDLLNPFVAGDRPFPPWLAAFQALLPGPAPMLSGDEAATPFDRLTAPPGEPVEAPQRVSVVVTAYRPDQGLLTAVRSLLAQTWRNVEVVIVDDASPPEYDAVLERAVALGGRIRLVRLSANAGTYAARNAGLDACGGEFVTFQDSDDWSHPRRLERQVRPLLATPELVATTSDGLSVTDRLLISRPGVRSGRFNPSSLLFRRDPVLRRVGYFDVVRKAGDSEYIGRIGAAFGARAVRHVDSAPLALIRLSENSLSRAEIRAHWMHPARVAYSSAYLRWHQLIAAGEADPYRPRDGAERPFPAPAHLTRGAAGPGAGRRYDVVLVADWRFLQSPQRAAVAESRALAEAGVRVGIVHLETYRSVRQRRVPPAAAVQQLVNDGVVDQLQLDERADAGLVLVRQATALQFAGGRPGEIRARRTVVVADRAPARGDGTDRRYTTVACTAVARELFGADPVWWPQDPAIRQALRTLGPALPLLPDDLPVAVAAAGWAAPRTGVPGARPVAGTDLCDQGGSPAERAEAFGVLRRLAGVDVRVRMSDRLRPESGLPASWLCYETADLAPQPFLHQLDFYLHYPHPAAVELWSQPVLEAAELGCVVVLPERFAARYGDVAVYAEPADVPAVLARYRGDPQLYAEQSRRAQEVVARVHHPKLFVDRITELVEPPRAVPPLQRGAPVAAG
jgi:O-antigen biosynthesis protein